MLNIKGTFVPIELKEQLKFHLNKILKNPDLGFHQLPLQDSVWQEAEGLNFEGKKLLLVVGIGGSSWGGRIFAEQKILAGNTKEVLFWDGMDPERLWADLPKIKRAFEEKTLAVSFISKSGNTLQTMALAEYLNTQLGPGFLTCCSVLTENKPSLLKNFADQHQLPLFPLAFNVGGRFSALSLVGLWPAKFLDLDLKQIQNGAREALAHGLDGIIEFSGEILLSFQREEWVTVFWPYSERLRAFGFWLQQLWGESLTKKLTRNQQKAPKVSYLTPCLGVRDQHSLLQQFAEGENKHFIVFLKAQKLALMDAGKQPQNQMESPITGVDLFKGLSLNDLLDCEFEGTKNSLMEQKTTQLTLSSAPLNEATIGYLIMFFELSIALIGEYYNIDAFNQPGVERSKQLTLELLKTKKNL